MANVLDIALCLDKPFIFIHPSQPHNRKERAIEVYLNIFYWKYLVIIKMLHF